MDIDCVIIGINSEKTLGRCIRHIRESRYSRGTVHIFYADGGSTDGSLDIAASFASVTPLALTPRYPTPGLGRNHGWRAGSAPLVQFLDSDAMLDPLWLDRAVDALDAHPKTAAVRGNRVELHPEASVFNWIGNLEWNAPEGTCEAFGGDVLIRREVLEETGGYDEVLVAGEDPELSRRIRKSGWEIRQLDLPMCGHDLAMFHVKQYWKRGHRTGYGYAAVTRRFGLKDGGFWVHEMFRIGLRGGGGMAMGAVALLLSVAHPLFLFLLFPGMALIFYPFLFSTSRLMAEKNLGRPAAMVYAVHCSLVVIPQFFGVFRFFWGYLFNRPLRNKAASLATGSSAAA